ncbi:MAG: transcription-repair coupling factor [Proteobacteria bacterium]|nr:transcription-repair coupling factor [Pseudomonadota bacterium]
METPIIHSIPNASAMAWALLRQCLNKKYCVLIPSAQWAYNLKDDLFFLDPSKEVYILNPLETNLLKHRGPSVHRRQERINFFLNYFQKQTQNNALFLINASALLPLSLESSFWDNQSLRIKTGDTLDVLSLANNLERLGYMKTDLVEKPFEYAQRGSILDVYSPTQNHPLRIELFEDTVQHMRFFFVDSQRTHSTTANETIPPAHEFIFPQDEKELKELRSQFRASLDGSSWAREDRDDFLDRITNRAFSPSLDYWASFFHPEHYSAPLNMVFPQIDLIVEPQLIDSELRSSFKEMTQNFLAARSENEWLPEINKFLRPADDSLSFLSSCLENPSTHFFLSREKSGLSLDSKNSSRSPLKSFDLFREKLNAQRETNRDKVLPLFASEVSQLIAEGFRGALACSTHADQERFSLLLPHYGISPTSKASFEEILKEPPAFFTILGLPQQSFIDPENKVFVVVDELILGRKKRASLSKTSSQKLTSSRDISFLGLKVNDLVVHKENGIACYQGLKTLSVQGIPTDFLELEFKDGKVFVPVTRLALIQKYSGPISDPSLDKLNARSWEQKRAKAKKDLRSIAGDLLNLYAKRSLAKGLSIKPTEEALNAFSETFPYTETPDQLEAINATLKDMTKDSPMDRLVCGDVGYGKTEIALRAAFATASCGYQAIILVPTTLLAAQHYKNFTKRLSPFGFKVAMLSRFQDNKETKEILKNLSEGSINVIVGTHRLLGNDINFKNPALLVIDEEQRFGVVHKEKIKKIRANLHVLSMTATPIPRTMNMALTGIKDFSVIATPPQNRLSVKTYVARKKEALIKEAIEREIHRGGQVFYLYNRVLTIHKPIEELSALFPHLKIEFVHGQLEEGLLEERMLRFYEGHTQVLVTTSIIEAGLDVPNANTLIVERADLFGLAQLYQIRGRVGRSENRAYSYFLLPETAAVSKDAEERLSVLESYQELGSGFHIATHDLEIRGAGDLLGREQSGQMSALGFEAYQELLQECLSELKGEDFEPQFDPEINVPVNSLIPVDYVPETGLRLLFYRRLSGALNENEIQEIEHELLDRFGSLPDSCQNLLQLMRMKCQLRRLKVRSLVAGKRGYSLTFDPKTPVKPMKLVEQIKKYPQHFLLQPDGKLTLLNAEPNIETQKLLRGVEAALAQIEEWCED